MTRLGDVLGHDRACGGERRVIELLERVEGGERRSQVHAEGAIIGQRVRDALVSGERRDGGCRAPEHQVAETDRVDLPCGEVGEPRIDQRRVARRPRCRAAVANPQLGVRQRVQTFPLDHPGLQRHRRGGDPFADALQTVLPRAVLPVAQQLRGAARREHRADPRHEGCDEVVAGVPGVAVLVFRHARDARGDDERRVRDDTVELLTCDRFEEAAATGVDALHLVEQRIDAGELQGARRDVRGDDRRRGGLSAQGEVGAQGLDAAARADVENPPGGRGQLQTGECEGGTPHAEDVARGQRPPERGLVEVAGDPPFGVVGSARDVLGTHENRRRDGIPVDPREAEVDQPLCSEHRQGARDGSTVGRHPEVQQAREGGERVTARCQGRQSRSVQPVADSGVGDRAPQRSDGVGAVAGGGEVAAQGADERGVGVQGGLHSIPSSRTPVRDAALGEATDRGDRGRSRAAHSTRTLESQLIVRSGIAQEPIPAMTVSFPAAARRPPDGVRGRRRRTIIGAARRGLRAAVLLAASTGMALAIVAAPAPAPADAATGAPEPSATPSATDAADAANLSVVVAPAGNGVVSTTVVSVAVAVSNTGDAPRRAER